MQRHPLRFPHGIFRWLVRFYEQRFIATGKREAINIGHRHGNGPSRAYYSICGMCGRELAPGWDNHPNAQYKKVRISPKKSHGRWWHKCPHCREEITNEPTPVVYHDFHDDTPDVMSEAWKTTGKNSQEFPSGFHCELPRQVDAMVEAGDRDGALQYAIDTIHREEVVV